MLRPAAALLSAAVLTACGSVPGESRPDGMERYAEDPRLGEPVDRVCFTSTIDGFSMNTRRTVVLHRGSKRYMVEVFGACPDLEYADAIGMVSPSACLSRMDAILVTRTSGSPGPRPQRCQIREIREWNPRAEAENPPET
ncbi:DUF6491 family protein [Hyphomonas sp.]|uniref:DUF6491 family protein n=1 Tax=Hyphomonas sp. TaxID=87 RepID=UPI00391D3E64